MKGNIKKYLGIDWGKKRIGLAIGDNLVNLASPFKVVKNIKEIKDIVETEDIKEIIIGKPLKMRNRDEKLNDDFLIFLESIEDEINISIKLIDERLTSKAADALAGPQKAKAPRDALAAMLILQTYLDKKISTRL